MKKIADEFNKIISECRRFAGKEIRPHALEMDLEPQHQWLRTLWEKSDSMDLPRLMLPELFNGAGYSSTCAALVLDTFAMECAGAASLFAGHFAACAGVIRISEEAENLIATFTKIMNAEKMPVFTILFPCDPDDATVACEKKGNGYVLSGESALVVGANCADYFLVMIPEETTDAACCFFIPADTPGVEVKGNVGLPGLKINPFSKICFHDVHVTPEMIMAEGNTGKSVMTAAANAYFGFIAAMAMGAARSSFIKALAYAKERYQFGKNIIHHPEIQRMLGNIRMKLGMGTAGYLQTFKKDTYKLPAGSLESRLAKVFCTDAALEIIEDAIQIHGGYGYMHEYGLEKIMRDVKTLQLLDGRNPHHLVEAIARQV